MRISSPVVQFSANARERARRWSVRGKLTLVVMA